MKKRTLQVAGLGLVGLVLLVLWYVAIVSGLPIAMLQAYLRGYRYDPHTERPDPSLVVARPEVLVRRQFEALRGETGPAPLRPDTPLAEYEVTNVHIVDWLSNRPTALVSVRLSFADGSRRIAVFDFTASAGTLLAPLPGGDEITRQVHAWSPDRNLATFFEEPAPATSIRDAAAPITLRHVDTIDAIVRAGEVGSVSSTVPSDIAEDGRLLFDRDVRDAEGRHTHTEMWLRERDGELRLLARTFLAARGTFSPDGRRVLYVESDHERPNTLTVRDAEGGTTEVASVDWMTHHWIDDTRIAYGADGQAILHSLRDDTRVPLARLAHDSRVYANYFPVSPGGTYLAYTDTDGRLWLLAVRSGNRKPIGWDVYEISWGAGIAWDADGTRLAYTTYNDTTLPGQAEVWVNDVQNGATLVARAEPDVHYGKVCWADAETLLFAATRSFGSVRLLAAASDGTGLWDVTPVGVTVPFPELTCANGYVAVPTDRTHLALFKIDTTT